MRPGLGAKSTMIRDMIVSLSIEGSDDIAGNYAISVAELFNAQVSAFAFVFIPVYPATTVMDLVNVNFIDAQQDKNRKRAQAAVERLEKAAKLRGISATARLVEAGVAEGARQFGQMARRFDLSIVGQAQPSQLEPDLITEAALFESGRPVIVVPYIQKQGMKLDRVMLCWDGSRTAARAVGDAMPIFQRAKNIEVVTVTELGTEDEIPGADIGYHLARHGLNVSVKKLVSGDIDAANIILSHAADSGTNFIVMGGYGHSRLREFVLGGVTRTMLASMTAPVLMSH